MRWRAQFTRLMRALKHFLSPLPLMLFLSDSNAA